MVPSSQDGLFFVGLPFQYAFASMLVGGVGRDAEGVADHIGAAMRAAARRAWHRTAGRPGHWVSSDEGAPGKFFETHARELKKRLIGANSPPNNSIKPH